MEGSAIKLLRNYNPNVTCMFRNTGGYSHHITFEIQLSKRTNLCWALFPVYSLERKSLLKGRIRSRSGLTMTESAVGGLHLSPLSI